MKSRPQKKTTRWLWRGDDALYPMEKGEATWERLEKWVNDGSLDAGYYMMAKTKRKKEAILITLPEFRCKFCGKPVEPTEDSMVRLLTRGIKNACPFYICPCRDYELQVFPDWYKLQNGLK